MTAKALAAEFAGVLLGYGEQYFSPGELVESLAACPAWGGYLREFETERGRSAAIGRYLSELGLAKAIHHRTRGSLYSSQATLERLRSAAEAAASSAAPDVIGFRPPRPEAAAPAGAAAPAAASSDKPGAHGGRRSSDAPVPSPPESGAGDAAAAPARVLPVIGWRRRATDRSREARSANPGAMFPQSGYGNGGSGPTLPAYPVPAPQGGALQSWTTVAEIPSPAVEEEPVLPLKFYWQQIRRHFLKIAAAVLVVTTAVGLYTLRIPKEFESVVTLRVDFKMPAMLADAENNPGFDPTTVIQTEVTDVTQREVILDAIANAHLDRNPFLLRQAGPAPRRLGTPADPAAGEDGLVALIAAHTSAVNPNNTDNIDIHYTSLDPATSAAVANAMAQALIEHEFQTRQQEQNDSLRFMQQQFNDVQARMEKEQAALTAYQHANNILNPDSQSSLETAALTTLQQNYLAAQSELTRYQAEENILKTGLVTDALLASADGAVLRPSYDAWRAAQLKFTQIQASRGSANPEYQAAAESLREARAQLDAAVQSVKNQLDSQYQRAQDQVTLVRRQLQAAQGDAQSFNDKAIDYDAQKRSFDADQKLYNDLLAQIKQQQLTNSLSASGLRVTNAAFPNPTPVYPSVRGNVMLAFLFSLFAGCGLAVLAGYLDRSFTSPAGIEQYLGIPLLGALPEMPSKSRPLELAEQRLEAHDGKAGPRSPYAEAVLMLRTAILYGAPQGFRSLCITSAQPQEGKSVALANLAVALALHGSKVLLVDGDIRRPAQHRIFEVPNSVGLTSLLRQLTPLDESFRPTTIEKLYLMPAGPAVPNPSELLATMLPQALAPLSAEFDFVLVDSPPLLGFADAISIATAVETTVLVARAGKTQREMVHAALQPLKRVRARVLGLVLNQVSSSLSPYYSYYQSHYAHYYGELAPAADTAPAPEEVRS